MSIRSQISKKEAQRAAQREVEGAKAQVNGGYGHPHDSVHDEISMAKACGEKHVTKKQHEQEKQTAAM